MENTLTISEIKRRGMSAISEHLRAGPIHIMKRNSVAAVILSVEEYQRLLQKDAALIPGMTAMQWLMSQPSSGQRRKAAMDADMASEPDDFLEQKVQTARKSIQAGLGTANKEVEAQFAARRAKVAGLA